MKSGVIFAFLLLWGGQAVGQQYLQLGAFRSIATGEFASAEWGTGSFAMDGWGVSIENKIGFEALREGLFLGFHVSYQRNEVDHRTMGMVLSNSLGQSVEVRPARYTPLVMTVGPFYDLAVSKRMSLGVKSGVGLMFSNVDTFIINVYSPEGSLAYSNFVDFNNSPGFTFLVGGKLGLALTRTMGVGLFADYSSGRETANNLQRNIEVPSSVSLSFLNAGFHMSADLGNPGITPSRKYTGKSKKRGKNRSKCYPIT